MFDLESDQVESSSIGDYNESIGSEKLANSIQKEDGKIKIKGVNKLNSFDNRQQNTDVPSTTGNMNLKDILDDDDP